MLSGAVRSLTETGTGRIDALTGVRPVGTTHRNLTFTSGLGLSDFLRIGELSVRTGKTRRTLHFYEELGLLTPASRTQGGFRQYDEASVQRVHWIGRLQDLGFSLPEIREFLANLLAQEQGPQAMDALRQLYVTKHDETRAQIQRLEALASELQESLQYLDECKQCAPMTPRLACSACDEHSTDEPLLVAAVRPSPHP